jgi:hypothetical protein
MEMADDVTDRMRKSLHIYMMERQPTAETLFCTLLKTYLNTIENWAVETEMGRVWLGQVAERLEKMPSQGKLFPDDKEDDQDGSRSD